MDARRWVRPRPHRLSHVGAAGESPVSPLGQIEAGNHVGGQLEALHASEPVGSEPVRAERAPGAPIVAHLRTHSPTLAHPRAILHASSCRRSKKRAAATIHRTAALGSRIERALAPFHFRQGASKVKQPYSRSGTQPVAASALMIASAACFAPSRTSIQWYGIGYRPTMHE